MSRGRRIIWLLVVMVALLLLLLGRAAEAQTSSLYTAEPTRPPERIDGLFVNPPLARASYTAVAPPQLRQFAVHDLVTIVIREQSTATSESTLETEKETKLDGGINAFPHFSATDLLNLRLRNSDSPEDLPQVDVSMKNEFSGEGEYERRDTMTTRLTARVIDVKPNGMLSLEARTYIRNDNETQTITVTGYCQPSDVAIDNSILSTQLFNLRVAKTNTGELRKTSEKGILTKILDAIFNF